MPANGAVEGASKAALAMLFQLLHDEDVVDAIEKTGITEASIIRRLNTGAWDAYDSLATITAIMACPPIFECIVDRVRANTALSETAARAIAEHAQADFEDALKKMLH